MKQISGFLENLPIINRIKNKTIKMLISYFVFGGMAFVVDYGLLFVFYSIFEIHYLVAAAMSFVGGVLTNYFLNKKYNFKNKSKNLVRQFTIFVGISLFGLLLNEVLLYLFHDIYAIPVLLAKPLTMVFIAPISFTLHKLITFKDKVS